MAEMRVALGLLQGCLPAPGSEWVYPAEAEGCVLSRAVTAREAMPPWPRAAMDGYAVRADDLAQASPDAPGVLRLVGETRPGHPFGGQVAPGAAVRIATGAPLPPGADAVVRYEEVAEGAEGEARFPNPPRPGQHVSRAGEDLPEGAVALPAGTVVGPVELGLLCMLGVSRVAVYRRPRVAILCTGDELVEPHQVPGAAQVRNGGGPILAALVRQAGGRPTYLGAFPDDPVAIARALDAAPASDLYLTTGGASFGASDRVAEAAALLGARPLFRRLAMKPGGACVGAVLQERPWVALSGNPGAAVIQFDLLVRPLVVALSGRRDMLLQPVRARLAAPAQGYRVRRFLRVQVWWQDGGLVADPGMAQQPTVLSSLAQAHGYAELAPGARLGAGEPVAVWLRPGCLPVPAAAPHLALL